MQPQLPTAFFAQLIARWGEKSPKFFKIIKVIAIALLLTSAVLWYVANHLLPYFHKEVPLWLSFAQGEVASLVEFLFVGLGAGGWLVGNLPLKDSSPPVDSPKLIPDSTEKPT